jgi:hypothetical protein
MLMKTGLLETAAPSSLLENFELEDWPSYRQELSMPPTITLERFSVFMLKAIISWRG